jgi:hypothetical protein
LAIRLKVAIPQDPRLEIKGEVKRSNLPGIITATAGSLPLRCATFAALEMESEVGYLMVSEPGVCQRRVSTTPELYEEAHLHRAEFESVRLSHRDINPVTPSLFGAEFQLFHSRQPVTNQSLSPSRTAMAITCTSTPSSGVLRWSAVWQTALQTVEEPINLILTSFRTKTPAV